MSSTNIHDRVFQSFNSYNESIDCRYSDSEFEST